MGVVAAFPLTLFFQHYLSLLFNPLTVTPRGATCHVLMVKESPLMLSALTRIRALVPPRRLNAGRWGAPPSSPSSPGGANAGAIDGRHALPGEVGWGFAVRREWANGLHDLFGFTPDVQAAQRRLEREGGYWRFGPVRPVAVYLVAANAGDVASHPVDGCDRSGCPDDPDRGRR